MWRMPEFCKVCNNVTELLPGKYKQRATNCGHIQQAKTLEAAKNLVAHGGEWPCTYSPIRNEFLKSLRPKRRRVMLHEIKSR